MYPLTFTRNFKRGATSATPHNVGIIDFEAGPTQTICKINSCTCKIVCAVSIDQHFNSAFVNTMISLLWVVKLHSILHPGATARFDKDPQAFVAVLRIFRDKVVQSSKGRVCHC